jgi:hypothetical protein
VTGPILPELQRNWVKTFGPHSLVPDWKESAAEYGREFVMRRVFYGLKHPSGSRAGPGIRWFAGEPARSISGMAYRLDPGTIWISATLGSWREIVTAAAHETVHTHGYHYDGKESYFEHELPTLVGKLAGAHWAGEREVYVKWGALPDNWLPEGESEVGTNAVVLNFDEGDHRTFVNAGQPARPRWEPRALCL